MDPTDRIEAFLEEPAVAVAGVSRDGDLPANFIYRRLRDAGYEVMAVNPAADTTEGDPCYPDLASLPRPVRAVMAATPPSGTEAVVEECLALEIPKIWIHRSFGEGSVSDRAVARAREGGMEVIVGGCPLMFVPPVDLAHRCMGWWLRRRGRIEV
jgi:hypothetical protein